MTIVNLEEEHLKFLSVKEHNKLLENKKQIARLTKQVEAVEAKAIREYGMEQLDKYYGRCFRYRNGGDGKHWWLYFIVTGIRFPYRGYELIGTTFQSYSGWKGQTYEMHEESDVGCLMYCSQAITPTQFQKHLALFLKRSGHARLLVSSSKKRRKNAKTK